MGDPAVRKRMRIAPDSKMLRRLRLRCHSRFCALMRGNKAAADGVTRA
jgi:hypothetical protein